MSQCNASCSAYNSMTSAAVSLLNLHLASVGTQVKGRAAVASPILTREPYTAQRATFQLLTAFATFYASHSSRDSVVRHEEPMQRCT